jgi:hypothetical protein
MTVLTSPEAIYSANRPILKSTATFMDFLEQDLEDPVKDIPFYCFVRWLSDRSVLYSLNE